MLELFKIIKGRQWLHTEQLCTNSVQSWALYQVGTEPLIYQCQYETVPDAPRHSLHSLCKKNNLFVYELLVFGVLLLDIDLCLGLGLVLELFSCCF